MNFPLTQHSKKGTKMKNDIYTTTPEAVIKAEGVLTAWRESRYDDVGAYLTSDINEPGGATRGWELLIALIAITDRAIDAVSSAIGLPENDVLKATTQLVAQAAYESNNPGKE
jgi:hypothetical protein